jgi:murein L,D-transpeptidase YcbB/YkuD
MTDSLVNRIKALEKICDDYQAEYDELAAAIAKTFTEENKAAYLKDKQAKWSSYRSFKYEIDQAKHEARMWEIRKERNLEELGQKRAKIQDITDLLEREKHCHDYAEVRLYGQDALAGYYAVTKTPTHYEFVLHRASSPEGAKHLLKTFTVSLAEPMGVGEFLNVIPSKISV